MFKNIWELVPNVGDEAKVYKRGGLFDNEIIIEMTLVRKTEKTIMLIGGKWDKRYISAYDQEKTLPTTKKALLLSNIESQRKKISYAERNISIAKDFIKTFEKELEEVENA